MIKINGSVDYFRDNVPFQIIPTRPIQLQIGECETVQLQNKSWLKAKVSQTSTSATPFTSMN